MLDALRGQSAQSHNLRNVLSDELKEDIETELEVRHITRIVLGVALLLLTAVMMPMLQDALHTLNTAQEQVQSLDSDWNTVSISPGEHASDSGGADTGDTITVWFYVSTQYLLDRDKSVDFIILDKENFQLYENGDSYEPLIQEDNLESGTISRRVPKSGTYYVVFDNSDDVFFEPQEEVKYRFTINTFNDKESLNLLVTFVLILPSISMIAIGSYGYWKLHSNDGMDDTPPPPASDLPPSTIPPPTSDLSSSTNSPLNSSE
jgi:hypothetical protein